MSKIEQNRTKSYRTSQIEKNSLPLFYHDLIKRELAQIRTITSK